MEIEKYEFFKVPFQPTGEFEFKKLTPAVKVLYYTFCRLARMYANKNTGWFFHSLSSLANDSNLNIKTVTQAKKILVKLNIIECKRGSRHNDHYRSADCYKINGIRMVK